MDWIRNRIISGRSNGSFGGFRRLTPLVALGVVLLALYSLFASTDPPIRAATDALSPNRCNFTAIYNFGDSNSDTGAVSATFDRVKPPNGLTFFGKDSGRYCDGRLVIDFIAEKLGFPYLEAYLDSIGADFKHGANFAASGSTIQDLDTKLCIGGFNPLTLQVQLSQFEQFRDRSVESYSRGKNSNPKIPLPKPESFSRALFTLDSGQNDIHVGLNTTSEEQVKASIPDLIDQFSSALEKLYKLGARAFWIHNTGPIGCLPLFLGQNPPKPNNTDSSGCIKSYNEVAQEFNKQLKQKISSLRSQLQDATLVYVDIYSVKYFLISHGKTERFPNPLGQCCGRMGKFECGNMVVENGTEVFEGACRNPSDYISWDSVHYTEAANKWVASRIFDGDFTEPKVPIAEACHMSSS